MGEQIDEQMSETNLNNSIVTFDNFRLLKEFSNISNLVKSDEFLEMVPKIKGVKWIQIFNCLKEDILSDMVQEISSMWEFENMPEKLEILDKQKEKFAAINSEGPLWRPQYDVKKHLRAYDVSNLQKQKVMLESLAQENETKANRLRRTVTAKRGYLKALQMDIQKYQKKNEQIISKINDKLINHGKLVSLTVPNMIDVNDIDWSDHLKIDE